METGSLRLSFVVMSLVALSVLILIGQQTPRTFSESAAPFAGPAGLALIQGDVDCDSDADSVDGLRVLQHVASISTPACIEAGDVDCSAATDSVDALKILRNLLALSVVQNEPCPDIGEPLVEEEFPGLAGPTSEDLIAQALEDGEIDEETALIYKIYAAFGDDALPAELRGDDRDVAETTALIEMALRFDELSEEAQVAMAPFSLPPNDPESWQTLRSSGGSSFVPPGGPWTTLDAVNGKVAIHWQRPEDEAKAQEVAGSLTAIWDKLTALMGREPLSDEGLENNGGDGRFDIYLAEFKAKGGLYPYNRTCESAGYMIVNRDQTPNKLGATFSHSAVAAHELMHAIQFAFQFKEDCISSYLWLIESTANWAKWFAMDEDETLHPYGVDFLSRPSSRLDSLKPLYHPYGAYLFPLFATQEYDDPAIIRKIFENAADFGGLEALNRAIPDGFEKAFPEFVAQNWNPGWDPLDKYREWDDFTGQAQAASGFAPKQVSLAGAQDERIELPVELDRLSSEYYHFDFTDDDVRTVIVYNGWTYKLTEFPEGFAAIQAEPLPEGETKGRTVQALVKIEGQDWERLDISDEPGLVYCRDKLDERVEELVLIFANSDHESEAKKTPKGVDPTVFVSNYGCGGWEGTAFSMSAQGGVTQTADAFVTWEQTGEGLPVPFSSAPAGNGSGTPVLIGLNRSYTAVAGSISWSVSGTDQAGCTHSGSGVVAIAGGGIGGSGLTTWQGVMGGIIYRTYTGVVTASEQGLATVTCPGVGSFDAPVLPAVVIASEPLPKVSPDGTRMADTFSQGGSQFEWDFKVQRE